MEEKNIGVALKEFCIHIFVGAVIFFVVSLFAVLLSEWVNYLEMREVSPIIVKGLLGFEYLIFGLDILLALFVMLRSTWILVKKL